MVRASKLVYTSMGNVIQNSRVLKKAGYLCTRHAYTKDLLKKAIHSLQNCTDIYNIQLKKTISQSFIIGTK